MPSKSTYDPSKKLDHMGYKHVGHIPDLVIPISGPKELEKMRPYALPYDNPNNVYGPYDTVFCHIILCYIVLYHVLLHCIIFYHIILHYIIFYHIIL